MKRSRKKYETPVRRFDKGRIESEKKLIKMYGLKTKKELWVTAALLRKYRRLARELAAKKDKEKESMLIKKMIGLGLIKEGSHLDDVLGMTINDFLERRLQTIIFRKGIAGSARHARQLIVHGKVLVGGKKIKYPSYIISADEEKKVNIVSAGVQQATEVVENA